MILRGQGAMRCAEFHPAEDCLVTTDDDHTAEVCDLRAGVEVRKIVAPQRYEGLDISGAIGLTEAQRSTLRTMGAIERR